MSRYKMSLDKNILVKLKDAGFRQNDKWLVKGVSLVVEKGKIVTLIGPNGTGKSTTAKIALGIYKKIDGEVEKYTNKIGYVPQKVTIDWTLPLRVSDFMVLTENIKDDAINEALSLTGVEHLKDKNLGTLSGGEFQRVLLARAISKKPELLVLDEPVQGVDFTGEIALYELIKKISEERNKNKEKEFGGAFYQALNIRFDSKGVEKFCLSKRLGKIAADLMKVNAVRIFHEKYEPH